MNTLDFPHRICMYQLLTSTVIASDGMYNPATGNHSNRPQVVNESETAGFPKLQSIHEFVRDKNLQSGGVLVLMIAGILHHLLCLLLTDPRVFMSRLATHPFQTVGGSGLQHPIPFNQMIQYRPIPQQQHQQQHPANIAMAGHMPMNSIIPTMHNGFGGNVLATVNGNNVIIGPNGFHIIDPTKHMMSSSVANFMASTGQPALNLNSSNGVSGNNSNHNNNMTSASTSNGNNSSSSTNAANVSQMSKLLKNIPQHLHDIHLIHLKDCKVRKFIPNKAKPEHPSHPLYHQFLEQLLQQRERLVKHGPKKAGESNNDSNRRGIGNRDYVGFQYSFDILSLCVCFAFR